LLATDIYRPFQTSSVLHRKKESAGEPVNSLRRNLLSESITNTRQPRKERLRDRSEKDRNPGAGVLPKGWIHGLDGDHDRFRSGQGRPAYGISWSDQGHFPEEVVGGKKEG